MGLIIFAISLCALFAIFWYIFALNWYFDWRYWAPEMLDDVVFLLIGLYMMKSGVKKKKRETSGSTKPLRNLGFRFLRRTTSTGSFGSEDETQSSRYSSDTCYTAELSCSGFLLP